MHPVDRPTGARETPPNTLVTTAMSNLGLFQAMKQKGINVRTTRVGDRYILEEMMANSYSFGGEQSGHVVFLDGCGSFEVR